MEFEVGARVRITKDIIGGRRNNGPANLNIKGRMGTLVAKSGYGSYNRQWRVRIDDDPGFQTQGGCWHVKQHQMSVIPPIETNETALIFLNKD